MVLSESALLFAVTLLVALRIGYDLYHYRIERQRNRKVDEIIAEDNANKK